MGGDKNRESSCFCAELSKFFICTTGRCFIVVQKLFIKLRLMQWLLSRREVNPSISRQQSSAGDLSTKNSYTELKHTKAYTDTTKTKKKNL